MDGTERTLRGILEGVRTDVSDDELFAVLADGHRRQALRVLETLEPPVALSTLARHVASEVGRDGEEAIQAIHLQLYHHHVPRLEAAEMVRYDPEQETVELTPTGSALALALSG